MPVDTALEVPISAVRDSIFRDPNLTTEQKVNADLLMLTADLVGDRNRNTSKDELRRALYDPVRDTPAFQGFGNKPTDSVSAEIIQRHIDKVSLPK